MVLKVDLLAQFGRQHQAAGLVDIGGIGLPVKQALEHLALHRAARVLRGDCSGDASTAALWRRSVGLDPVVLLGGSLSPSWA